MNVDWKIEEATKFLKSSLAEKLNCTTEDVDVVLTLKDSNQGVTMHYSAPVAKINTLIETL